MNESGDDLGVGWHVFRAATNEWIVGLSHWDIATLVVAGTITLDDRARYFNSEKLTKVGELPIKDLVELVRQRKQSDLRFETARQRQMYLEDAKLEGQKQREAIDRKISSSIPGELSRRLPRNGTEQQLWKDSCEETKFAVSSSPARPLIPEGPAYSQTSSARLESKSEAGHQSLDERTSDDRPMGKTEASESKAMMADEASAAAERPLSPNRAEAIVSIPTAANLLTDSCEGTIVSYGVFTGRGQIQLDTAAILSFKSERISGHARIPDCPVGTRVDVSLKMTRDGPIIEEVKLKEIKAFSPLPPKQSSKETTVAYEAELAELMRRSPRSVLATWSDIDIDPKGQKGKRRYGSKDLDKLKNLARRETWCFKGQQDYLSILRDYLKFTFYRSARQGKVIFTDQFAAFNTRLFDKRKEPIFALFQRNDVKRLWMLQAFCTLATGRPGKLLMELFGGEELPPAANYLDNADDGIKPENKIHPWWEHVMEHALAGRRYPLEFMMRHLPRGMPKTAPEQPNVDWCKEYVRLLEKDEDKLPAFKESVEDAINRAKDAVRKNPKLAVPNYYAGKNKMSYFLPLYLLGNKAPELALVVEEKTETSYYGSTVYPLSWAYIYARVVSKPQAEWLSIENIVLSELELEDQ